MKIFAGIVSLLFVVLAALHVFVDTITIDAIAIVLIILAALPWVFPYLRALELPGGVKIELKDVQEVMEKVSGGSTHEEEIGNNEYGSLKSIAETDPNLALVAIRIEIEKAIRNSHGEEGRPVPLVRAVQRLASDRTITGEVASGLIDFIHLGNEAAHGVAVDEAAAKYAIKNVGNLLKPFKEQLANTV